MDISKLKQIIKEEIKKSLVEKSKEGLMYAVATNIAKYGQPQTPKDAKPTHLTKKQKVKKEKTVLDLKKSMTECSCEDEIKNYMFFQNLMTIKQEIDEMLQMDQNYVDMILSQGHGWANDHITTSKDDIEEVYNFLMNKEMMTEKAKFTKKFDTDPTLKGNQKQLPDTLQQAIIAKKTKSIK